MRVVVAGVIGRDGRVLAARRTRPADLAGRWEFPGGKLEPGETEPAALARELVEELGIEVVVGELIGRVPLSADYELAVYACRLVTGIPRPDGAHDAVAWVASEEWDDTDWVDADRELLPAVRRFLLET